jgi:hypothetical protein
MELVIAEGSLGGTTFLMDQEGELAFISGGGEGAVLQGSGQAVAARS